MALVYQDLYSTQLPEERAVSLVQKTPSLTAHILPASNKVGRDDGNGLGVAK